MKKIIEIFNSLIEYEKKNLYTINLVPSESTFSFAYKIPFLSDAYHRYFFNEEGLSSKWDFMALKNISWIETEIAIPLLKELFNANYVSLRPLSGLHLMTITLSGLTKIGDNIICVSPNLGGHPSTAEISKRLGLKVSFIKENNFKPDLVDFENNIYKTKPSLIYIDQSHGLFPIEIEKIIEVVKKSNLNTKIHVDASHWLGFILGKSLPNPLELGADSFGGSTHKTFPGPHRGVFATNDKTIFELFNSMQYSMISNHNFASVISLALCLIDFKDRLNNSYSEKLLENTKNMGFFLNQFGVNVIAKDLNYSRGHQLWIKLNSNGISAIKVSSLLNEIGINVNCLSDLPNISEPAIRIGLNEVTYFGLDKNDIYEIAKIISEVIHGENIELLREKVSIIALKQKKNNLNNEIISNKIDELWNVIRRPNR